MKREGCALMGGDHDGKGKRQRPEDAVPDKPGDEESEEEQVDRFFALLKSVREMREQRRREGGSSVARKRHKVEGSSWTPTFQWEDFAVVPSNGEAGVAATSKREGRHRGKEAKEGEGTRLDLNLSL